MPELGLQGLGDGLDQARVREGIDHVHQVEPIGAQALAHQRGELGVTRWKGMATSWKTSPTMTSKRARCPQGQPGVAVLDAHGLRVQIPADSTAVGDRRVQLRDGDGARPGSAVCTARGWL
jgi:hypothetical protein